MSYAVKKNYIPVVDQLNYMTEYTENVPVNGTKNVWEYYFLQPQKESLQRAYASKNYILSDYAIHSEELPYTEKNIDDYTINEAQLQKIHKLILNSIQLRPELQSHLDVKWEQFKSCYKGKIIGVHVRGTDKRTPPPGHYKAQGLDIYIKSVNKLCEKYPDSCIFLCCDEIKTIDVFAEQYGNRLFYNDVYRAKGNSNTGIHLENSNNSRGLHKYQLGLEVIMDTYMLARCDILVHTHSNVTNAAILLNGGVYEERIFVG